MTATVTVATIPLGRLVMTAAVVALIDEQPALAPMLPVWLGRHARNDCPNLSDDDRAANAWSIEAGERVLTSWPISEAEDSERVWILTEWDRSQTTVLLPSDY
jgi:hypothetical protein